jgi:hypothetical protein
MESVDGMPPYTWVVDGHRFVAPNTWHSCRHYELEEPFVGKDPLVGSFFAHLVEAVQKFGPVTVYAQKTRIVIQSRTRIGNPTKIESARRT